MAQTGFTPIQIYSSSTAAAAPAVGNLTNSTLGAELAINITDGKLFYKDNANAIQVIAWKVTPTSAGGTGLTSYTAGDLLFYASGTALSKLAIGASGQYLASSGSAPQWNAPAALTKTDDTNVTLTLGGSASTALLNAASLTLGWSGTLAVSRGGTGTGTAGITAFNNITGYTASGATGTTSTNLVFSTSPSITTPTLVGDATLSTGNLVVSTANKGITSNGGLFLQTSASVAAGGTLDLTLDVNGFVGILSVSNTRDNFTPQSRRQVTAVACYGTTFTSSLLHNQDGTGGAPAYTITVPSAGTVRFTDTSGDGSTKSVFLTFSGSRSAG
jgi:hypothetical protein